MTLESVELADVISNIRAADCRVRMVGMATVRTRAPDPTASGEAEPGFNLADDEAAIARVSAARQAGDEDPRGIEELLRRAGNRNRAALDRLAK